MKRSQREIKAQREIDAFNRAVPVGADVVYWPVLIPGEPRKNGRRVKTRARASMVSEQSCVWVRGIAGCVSTAHVQLRDQVDSRTANFDPEFQHQWEA